jgi:hypothetical protein
MATKDENASALTFRELMDLLTDAEACPREGSAHEAEWDWDARSVTCHDCQEDIPFTHLGRTELEAVLPHVKRGRRRKRRLRLVPHDSQGGQTVGDGQDGPRIRTEAERNVNGAQFIFERPEVAAIWGDSERVLWAQGEALMLVGPQGTGKTTILQQLALHKLGVRPGSFLGLPVAPLGNRGLDSPIVYLAMDRPYQAARSFGRMVTEADRDLLEKGLRVWRGPLPVNVLKEPAVLADWMDDEFGSVGAVFLIPSRTSLPV